MSAPPAGPDFLVCVYCGCPWRPGLTEDCVICRGITRQDLHGSHTVCPSCFIVLRRVRKGVDLTEAERAHLLRVPELRRKLALEMEHALPRKPRTPSPPPTSGQEAKTDREGSQDDSQSEGGA